MTPRGEFHLYRELKRQCRANKKQGGDFELVTFKVSAELLSAKSKLLYFFPRLFSGRGGSLTSVLYCLVMQCYLSREAPEEPICREGEEGWKHIFSEHGGLHLNIFPLFKRCIDDDIRWTPLKHISSCLRCVDDDLGILWTPLKLDAIAEASFSLFLTLYR